MRKTLLTITAIILNAFAIFLVGFVINYQLQQAEKQEEVVAFNKEEVLHLAFVGDLMCHQGNYEAAELEKGGYDFRPVFKRVRPFLQEADMAFGNLETVFKGNAQGRKYAGYPTFNTPDTYANALAYAGFDCLFTANNHAWDGGAKGVARTLNVLAETGLMNVGTQETREERSTVKIFELKNIKFSVLAYTEKSNGKVPKSLHYMLNLIDTAQIRKDIENVKAKGAEMVIINFHFGKENERLPNTYQKEIVQHAIDCGADIIVGEHPHVLQPVQLFKGSGSASLDTGLVAFSLGNFYSQQLGKYTNSGIILNIKLEKDKDSGKIRLNHHFAIPTFVAQYTEAEKKQFVIVHGNLSKQQLLPQRLRKGLPKETSLLSKSQFRQMEQAFSDVEKLLSASDQ